MNLLYALESVRTPFWDAVFSAVTHLGEETVFMVAAILIFWCVSKQEGYYLLLMGFFGTVVNQFLKLLFRIPRPWVRDPDFTIVESARAQATGYSFPSGHTQNAVATFGGIARSTRRPWVRWACVAVLLLAYMMPSLRTMFNAGSAVALAVFTGLAGAASVLVGLRTRSFTLGCLLFAALCMGLSGLFLLKSAWLTSAFSTVLSALCLFTPFEEFVNNSFSLPTLVYYLSVTGLFLFFTAQSIEKRRWN